MQFYRCPQNFSFYASYYKTGASRTNLIPSKFIQLKDQGTLKPFTNSCYPSSYLNFSCRLHSCPWYQLYPLCFPATSSSLPCVFSLPILSKTLHHNSRDACTKDGQGNRIKWVDDQAVLLFAFTGQDDKKRRSSCCKV